MKWIDTTDLKNWATRRDCQENLPLVIRRLVRATIDKDKIINISFPAGDSVVYSGWDAILESNQETEYIPKGLSAWELGTGQNIKEKAENEYKKRKKNPLGISPSDATFIFVTPRVWAEKEKWIREKKEENSWKDIRVYDARDLEEWLEQAPAVGAWLAKHISKYPEGVRSLEDWWNDWSQTTRPQLTPKLVLAGRKKQIEEIKKFLKDPPSLLAVQASSKEESTAFLSAIIFLLPEEEKEFFLSKSIVVFDEKAFRHITTTCKNGLLLIQEFEEIGTVVSQHSHHVYIPLNPDNIVSKEKIVLPRLGREEFISALKEMGIDEEKAEKLSKDTARSLNVLKRLLSSVSNQPEWATPEKAREILSVLLAGKWDEGNEEDKRIISKIAGIPYSEVTATLKKWIFKPDSPILKISKIWRLTSPLDAFFALAPFLTQDDLNNFKSISLKVLKEIDPSLELEPEKRWMALVYKKIPKYSKMLREGIAQTLLLIAVFGDKINNGKGLDLLCSAQSWVNNIIQELLNDADGKLWCSLEDVLPLVAEASPSSFLDAIEDSLSKESPPIMEMFSEIEDSLTSHSYHSSLLWALEGLAWDPNLLGRVTLILGKLAKLALGRKLVNRPINSLRTIFLLNHPHTYATLEQRLKAIEILIEREPKISWNLLISLMPRWNDSYSSTYKPRWREFSEKTDNKVMVKEYIEGISAIVNMMLKNVGDNGKNWAEVMDHYSSLPPQEMEKVITDLSNSVDLIKNGRNNVWNKLREILANHRFFSSAKWALPEDELKKIEEICNKLKPQDIIESHVWLFDDYWPKLPEGKEKSDYKELERVVKQKRVKAVQDIKNELGFEGLIKLTEQSKEPQLVGTATAELQLTNNEEEILFSLLDSIDKKRIAFVQGYIRRKSFRNGEVWIENIVDIALSQNWPSKKMTNLFLAFPQNRKIWELLEKFDAQTQEEYWKKIQPKFLDLSVDDKIYALEKLIDVERHFIALKTAAIFAKDLSPKLITKLLMKAALEKSIDDFSIVSPWDIEELFEALDHSNDVGRSKIVKLEWLYLPILAEMGSKRPPRMLYQELSDNPVFFAEIIKYIYRPKNEDRTEEEEDLPQELKKQKAYFAWELIHSWKTVPGSDNSGRIDYQKLRSWVDKARDLCKKLDRLEACDKHIGQVLAHAISDENGDWPPEEVCRIIDDIGSKKLENGFVIEIYNKRGVVTKSPFEGGEQEQTLAEKYRKYADKLAIRFPKTSTVLRKVAEYYENEAKRENAEADRLNIEW